MKKISINKCVRGISTGILATALSLMAGTVITQAEPVKEGENCVIPLTKEVKLDMVWIKPGTFMMGSPKDELGRESDEVQHEVTLTQGYWLGKYEVTQEQYKAILGRPIENGDNYPVDHISWDDAIEFCEKLTARESETGRLPKGYEYTLPTEAQWEYACRAGTTTALNSGKNLSDKIKCPEMGEVGWYENNAYDNDKHPVGRKKPNAWGLYDMHGNVWEWCSDRYGDYPASSVTDPEGPDNGSSRVLRGGSWYSSADRCRSAYRFNYYPSYSYDFSGFRVALSPVQ